MLEAPRGVNESGDFPFHETGGVRSHPCVVEGLDQPAV